MRKTYGGCVVLAVLVCAACNSYNTPKRTTSANQPKLRAFVSNPVHPNATGGGSPAIDVVDASRDQVSGFVIPLSSLGTGVSDAGAMVVSPKKDFTLMFSPADEKLAVIGNSQLSLLASIGLPGSTESFFVWTDDTTIFVALPNAAVLGQSPGVVQRMSVATRSTTASLPIPGAHYLVPSPDGKRILVISDNTNTVTVVDPNLINSGNPLTPIQNLAGCVPDLDQPNACFFDRPVAAVFSSDGTKAYILNCGKQCGGQSFSATNCAQLSCGSITTLDMGTLMPVTPMALPNAGATAALLVNGTLYVAGTAPPVQAGQNTCSAVTTAATRCGQLTSIALSSMSVTGSAVITDGHHTHMQMGANGQLFIGSRNCTNINVSGGEMRGCLSIVDTSSPLSNSSVVVPPDNGDVTGIATIPDRPPSGQISPSVVYVCEGGRLRVYDTSRDPSSNKPRDKLEVLTIPPTVIGQAIDVAVVDF